MTTHTYRGVPYTPVDGKTAAPKIDNLIYRGCITRAITAPTVAPTMTRTWRGYKYQLTS